MLMQLLWQSPTRGPIASLMIVLYCLMFLVMPIVALAQQGDDCAQGKADGERDGKGNALWFLAGLGCGIIGFGAAFLIKPSPNANALLGKSSDYVVCYTEAYQAKAKGKNVLYAGLGWGAWMIIYFAAIYPNLD
jgi:hypothetical protein